MAIQEDGSATRWSRVLLAAGTALGTILSVCGPLQPAFAQSVASTGDVSPEQTPTPSSHWDVGDELTIGFSGAGALTIEDGGSLTNTTGVLGHLAGSEGTAVVRGAGTTWTNNGFLFIGVDGTGSMTIEQGGGVTSGLGVLGDEKTGEGTATVTGAGSNWAISQELYVGNKGNGTFMISDGGVVENQNGVIGRLSGSTGSVTVTGAGSSWTNSGELIVGFGYHDNFHLFDGTGGAGTLTISDGGTVTNVDGTIGGYSFSTGRVTVTGAGSTWTNKGNLNVGVGGYGNLLIEDGGTVSSKTGGIGGSAGGAALVSGAGSTWNNESILTVAVRGDGALVIKDGGKVTSQHTAIGLFAGQGSLPVANGAVTVTGSGSALVNSHDLFVGGSGLFNNGGGNATLTVLDGASVTNDNGYIGAAASSKGTATIAGQGSTWTNQGDLTIGDKGDGTLTIADGGAVSVGSGSGTINLAVDAGIDGTLNIGAASGEAPALAGTLDAGQIVFGAGDGALVFNHAGDLDGAALVFGAELSGLGTILQENGATVLSAHSSSFIGETAVTGGALIVNGILGGVLSVGDGGTLGGSGTVGDVTLSSGSVIAPGNSVGTLTVAGDITFDDGSIYEVEVDAAGSGSDMIHASGRATLGSGSVIRIGPGVLDPFSTRTILKADSGVYGIFGEIASSYAFLTPNLTYDADSIDLSLTRNTIGFADRATTRNQQSVAESAESLGQGNAVYNAVAALPDDNALIGAGFDALSGEIHASAKSVLIEESRFLRYAVNERIGTAFGNAGAKALPILAYAAGGAPKVVAADDAGPVFWAHGFGAWNSTDGNSNTASLDSDTGGLLIGTDAAVGDWRVGVLAGYSHSGFSMDDRASSGTSDNYHLGLYGGRQWKQLSLSAGAAYSWHGIETSRAVVLPGLSDGLTADYDAGTFQVFGDLGYGIELQSGARLEPFVNLAHVSLHSGGFSENGGAAGLSARGGSMNSTFATLGLRAEHDMTLGGVETKLRGAIGWRHAFGDTSATSTNAFSSGPGFTVAGSPISENSLLLEAGLDISLSERATLGVSYQGQAAAALLQHGLNGMLRVRF
ncbi:outer membrane autotransporter barrel domain-containing protein [Nitratireductor indicus C115]|uniref:Outer membrane autotransporter barrel domain-containing protein n=1 Tax=Nitratireductor indicus C115 TaxID=1231190 RepID=K2NPN1_9HYPH|nr:autotransporter domain-containing protein [Nitratireductor indicus]EKF39809.1 outer membrane autotransporter barrel domain-containing protein [Nitratireductor indicus C115]SFQ69208.1 outer membrane autotransporter barrel domain-containing protein [Nitratireductor indicus]